MAKREQGSGNGSGKMSEPPVVRGCNLFSTAEAFTEPPQELVKEVRNACENWGMFQMVDSGFDRALIERTETAMHTLFDLPVEKKKEVSDDVFL